MKLNSIKKNSIKNRFPTKLNLINIPNLMLSMLHHLKIHSIINYLTVDWKVMDLLLRKIIIIFMESREMGIMKRKREKNEIQLEIVIDN
jgi:hypothetical protein